MRFEGANSNPEIVGVEKLLGIVNYFIGNDPTKWRTNIPTYAKVEYKDIYPGIDLVYYGNQRQLEYDLVVAPGADPDQIKLTFKGTEDVQLNDRGDLILSTGSGAVRLFKPHVYQNVNGQKTRVAAQYVVVSSDARDARIAPHASVSVKVGIQVAKYVDTSPLVIDPGLLYSSPLGGSDVDTARDVTVDASGNAYIVGTTSSSNFPTVGAEDSALGGTHDVFITKIDATGNDFVYSTFFGGSGNETGNGIAVDPACQADAALACNVYFTGVTDSSDFPTFPRSAYQSNHSPGQPDDAFAVKLDANGQSGGASAYSTFLGGSSDDVGSAIAVDGSGRAYVTGSTKSSNFVKKVPGFLGKNAGGRDAFVLRLTSDGTALEYFSYLGGSNDDTGNDIVVDGNGRAHVTGETQSPNFPVANFLTAPPHDGGTFAGGLTDAFVTRLSNDGLLLEFSTFLGGSGDESGESLTLSGSTVYLAGATTSKDFPVSALGGNAQDISCGTDGFCNGGSRDAFVTELHASGALTLGFSSYLGGSQEDGAKGIAVDNVIPPNVYVTGVTHSSSADFPIIDPLLAPPPPLNGELQGASDAFVSKIDLSGAGTAQFEYSTFLGGSGDDSGEGIAVDGTRSAYVVGSTTSADFPSKTLPAPPNNPTPPDAWIAKLGNTPPVAEDALKQMCEDGDDANPCVGNINPGPVSITLVAFDVDGPNALGFTIESLPTNGTLFQGDGVTAYTSAGSSVPSDDITCTQTGLRFDCTAQVAYQPDPDYFGPDGFTFTAFDGLATSNEATVSIDVLPVNDAPSFTRGDNQVISEDAGPQAVVAWATDITAGPPNESTQSLTFLVTTDNDALFAQLPAIDPNTGTLTYTPAPNLNGTANLTVVLVDDGGTENGGEDTSGQEFPVIQVTPAPDVPVLDSIGNKVVKEGVPLQFTVRGTDVDVQTDLYGGDTLSLSAIGLPPGATFVPGASVPGSTDPFTPVSIEGQFSFTPGFNLAAPGADGLAIVKFTVQDQTGAMDSEVVAITIQDDPDHPDNDFDGVVEAKLAGEDLLIDNCGGPGTELVFNPDQGDADNDGVGDKCDETPTAVGNPVTQENNVFAPLTITGLVCFQPADQPYTAVIPTDINGLVQCTVFDDQGNELSPLSIPEGSGISFAPGSGQTILVQDQEVCVPVTVDVSNFNPPEGSLNAICDYTQFTNNPGTQTVVYLGTAQGNLVTLLNGVYVVNVFPPSSPSPCCNSTLPVKFEATFEGQVLGDARHTCTIQEVVGGNLVGDPIDCVHADNANDPGDNSFVFLPDEQLFKFELSLNLTPGLHPGFWEIQLNLDSGQIERIPMELR